MNEPWSALDADGDKCLSLQRPHWRWKLRLYWGGWAYFLPNWRDNELKILLGEGGGSYQRGHFTANPDFSWKVSPWQTISINLKVMFPFGSKKTGLSGVVCLQFRQNSLSLPIKGGKKKKKAATFMECPLIWQSQNTFDFIIQISDSVRTYQVSCLRPSWKSLTDVFDGDLLSVVWDSEYSALSASIFRQSCWFRNKMTQPCHSMPLSL